MRNVECGMWNMECGMRNAECGIWNAEYGMWNMECGMWNAECGMWNAEWRKATYERVGYLFWFFVMATKMLIISSQKVLIGSNLSSGM